MKNKHKLFKSKKEEQEWLKNNMLVVKDLIVFLEKLDPDSLIYMPNSQTRILEELRKDPEELFKTVRKDKLCMKKILENWYRSSYSTKEALQNKIKEELDEIYQYASNKGLVVQC